MGEHEWKEAIDKAKEEWECVREIEGDGPDPLHEVTRAFKGMPCDTHVRSNIVLTSFEEFREFLLFRPTGRAGLSLTAPKTKSHDKGKGTELGNTFGILADDNWWFVFDSHMHYAKPGGLKQGMLVAYNSDGHECDIARFVFEKLLPSAECAPSQLDIIAVSMVAWEGGSEGASASGNSEVFRAGVPHLCSLHPSVASWCQPCTTAVADVQVADMGENVEKEPRQARSDQGAHAAPAEEAGEREK